MTSPTVPIAIVVVNYNDDERTMQCVESLRESAQHGACSADEVRIYVVSNGERRSAELLTVLDATRSLQLIDAENRGYGAALNLGFDRASSEQPSFYLVGMNSDITVPPNFLASVRAVAKSFPVGRLWGFDVIARSGALQCVGGGRLGRWSGRARPRRFASGRLDYIDGATFALSADDFRRGCKFDEVFFLYYEDVDLSLTALSLGMQLAVVPKTHVVHESGVSTGSRRGPGKSALAAYHISRSAVYLCRKWRHRRLPIVIASRLAAALQQALTGNRAACQASCRGARAGLRPPSIPQQ